MKYYTESIDEIHFSAYDAMGIYFVHHYWCQIAKSWIDRWYKELVVNVATCYRKELWSICVIKQMNKTKPYLNIPEERNDL